MDIYTGALQYKNNDFTFVFDGDNLKLIPKNKNLVFSWTHIEIMKGVFVDGDPVSMDDSVIVGVCNETMQRIVFIMQKGSRVSWNNMTLSVRPLAFVLCKARREMISSISVSCPELDFIFPIGDAFDIPITEEVINEGSYSIQSKPFEENTSSKAEFEFQGRTIKTYLSVSRSVRSRGKAPIEFSSVLHFEVADTNDWFFAYQLVFIAIRFVEFLCNRRNIALDSIALYCKRGENGYENFAQMFLLREIETDDEADTKSRFIPYQCIAGCEGRMFQEIADDTVYSRHLPLSYRLGQSITAATFVMITAAFEWEFRQLYPNGIEKKTKTIEIEKKATEIFDQLIENNTGVLKKIFKTMKKHISSDDLSGKIKYVGDQLARMLDPLGKHLYGLNKHEWVCSEMGDRVAMQRNNFAHGNLDKEFIDLALLDIVFLERIVYVMQLKRLGLTDRSILEAINSLFNLHLCFDDYFKEDEEQPDSVI